MKFGKIKSTQKMRIFLFFFMIAFSCNSHVKNTKSDDQLNIELFNLTESLSERYVIETKKDNDIEKPMDVIAVLNSKNQDYFEITIYVSSIILDGQVVYKGRTFYDQYGKNEIYIVSDDKTLFPENIEQYVSKSNSSGSLKFIVNDLLSWNCFVCKDDIKKIKIIKLPYVIQEYQKPVNFCN